MNNAILKQSYGDEKDKESSDEWERIKDFVGSAKKDSKHPIHQELERAQRHVQNFDEGGMVDAVPQILGDLTPGSSDQLKTQGLPVAPPVPNAPQGPKIAPTAPNVVPPNPVGVTPAPTGTLAPQTSDQQANKALGGITPDAIARYVQSLNKQSKPPLIGAGIAGIGDAISSIGGQHPEAMKTALEGIEKNKENAMKVPEQMAAIGKQKFEITHQLDEENPKSALSKQIVGGYANTPLGQKLGIKPGVQSAKTVSDITGKSIDQLKTEMESKMKAADIENQNKARELQANTETMKGSKLPFFGPSHAQKEAASNAIARIGAGGTSAAGAKYSPDVISYAQKHGISPEQAQEVKDKRTGGQ